MQNLSMTRLYFEPIDMSLFGMIERRSMQDSLSIREREVLSLILKGKTVGEIGLALCISTGTAKTHKNNIYQKLGVSCKSQLFEKCSDRWQW